MKLITTHSLAKTVAERFQVQYCIDGVWKEVSAFNTGEVYKELISLGKNPNPKVIDELLGNITWTHPICHDCNEYVEKAIQFGRVKAPFFVCFPCLKNVFRKLFK